MDGENQNKIPAIIVVVVEADLTQYTYIHGPNFYQIKIEKKFKLFEKNHHHHHRILMQ